MEVTLFEGGRRTPKICQVISVTLKSDQGKQLLFTAQSSPTLFGQAAESSLYGGWIVLDPDIYDGGQSGGGAVIGGGYPPVHHHH